MEKEHMQTTAPAPSAPGSLQLVLFSCFFILPERDKSSTAGRKVRLAQRDHSCSWSQLQSPTYQNVVRHSIFCYLGSHYGFELFFDTVYMSCLLL